MLNSKTFLLTALLALSPMLALAAEDGDLYAAQTVVADEGSETRNAALSELLADVLVRVSGNTAVAGQPAAREILQAAPSLVQQYRYRTADRDGEVVRYLWASFDQPVVERMMRERNLPVWTQRPRVLLWIATEQQGQRALFNPDNAPEARAALLAQAGQRGMPLQLPLLDLEDQTQLAPADVWSDYQPAIRQASARYPHDVIVAARLRAQSDGRWSGNWSIYERDGTRTFQTPGQALPETLAFAVDQVQNLLAARFAPMPGAGGAGTLVSFSAVYDLAAYARLVGLLEGLENVAQMALRHVQGETFTFELRLRGTEQDLVRALESGGQLVAEPPPMRVEQAADGAPATAMAPEAELNFRLVF